MTKTESKQQVANFNATIKAQKEAEERVFKRNAREEALRTAKFILVNDTSDKILKDADKIYRWLIKKV